MDERFDEEEDASVAIAGVIYIVCGLCAVLVVLKLVGAINIPWWGVFLPLLIPIGCTLCLAVAFLILYGFVSVISDRKKTNRKRRGGKK